MSEMYAPLEFQVVGDVDHELMQQLTRLRNNLQGLRNLNRPLENIRRNLGHTHTALQRLVHTIERIVFRRAVIAVLREISDGFKEGRDNAYQYAKIIGNEFASSMDRLATSTFYMKNSIGAMVMPIYNALVPAIEWLIDRFVALINIVNQFFSLLNGAATWTKALKYPKEYADATNKATGAVKELQKTILKFDEINKLNKQSAGGGGGLANALDYSKMFEQADYSPFLEKHLKEIEVMLAGFEFVLGAILALTGHPLIGTALMAHGAYKLFKAHVSTDWSAVTKEMTNTLALIETTVGTFALALGVMLLGVPNHLGLALAMIATGAVLLYRGVSVNWDSPLADITTALTTITGIVAGFTLALGAMLFLSGVNTAVGLGLMLSGAILLTTAVMANWDDIPAKVSDTMFKIMQIIGAGLVVIGAVLLMMGHPALGAGLMIAGGIGTMAEAIVPNWSAISTYIGVVFAVIMNMIPPALMVIGLAFLMMGNYALGLGLMIAGGIGIYASTGMSVDWEKLITELGTAVSNVLKVVGGSLLAIGFVMLLMGNIGLGAGLMLAGGVAMFATTLPSVDFNALPKALSTPIEKVKQLYRGLNSWLGSFRLKQPQVSGYRYLNLFGQSISLPTISFMANGGFPDRGSLFVAGESGAEMVGSLGGRTAVANSDQIVQGIAQGLRNANVDELRLMREQNDLLRQILAKEGTATVTLSSVTQALERKNQRDGGTYVPVG